MTEEHKEEGRRRRERYRNDPVFRAACIAAAKAYHETHVVDALYRERVRVTKRINELKHRIVNYQEKLKDAEEQLAPLLARNAELKRLRRDERNGKEIL
jgi:uncharacterized coiled-coil DUF342 family protein